MCAVQSCDGVRGSWPVPLELAPSGLHSCTCARDISEGGGVPQRVASAGRWGSGRCLPWGPAARRCGEFGLTLVYVKPGCREVNTR